VTLGLPQDHLTETNMEKIQKFQNASSYTYSPGYTFPGNLPLELFRKNTIGTPPISDMFTLRQGIRTDEFLILVGNLEKILKATTGCSPTYSTGGTFTDRKITVGKFEANMQWCKSDFIATASALTNDPTFVKNGLDGYNASAQVRDVWMSEMIDAIRRDIWRIVLFGNTASGNADYNVINGLFVKLYDAFASYCVKRVGNDLPNTTAAVLTTDQALNALKTCHTQAHPTLKQLDITQKVFWVTGSMYENLLASYESKTPGAIQLQFDLQVGKGAGALGGRFSSADSLGLAGTGSDSTPASFNVPVLYYRGIPVVPLYIADNYLADSNNPWFGSLANFAIYTTTGNSKFANLVIGTESSSDLDRIDMFYDQRTKTTFAQHESRFGTNFIQCDLTCFYD